MLRRLRSVGQTLIPVVGLVALVNTGCANTIAGRYPKLDRRAVCVLPPEIEPDSTEYIFTKENVPVSNFHSETIDKAAETARTVFELDPYADPASVRHLPAPYNELTCPARFSMLPSKDAETPPLPSAAIDLLVQEARPEPVPQAVAEKLANCASPSNSELKPAEYTMAFNVYVTSDGQAVAATVAQSTLADRKIQACFVDALRTTSWPMETPIANANPVQTGASTVSLASKLFLGQPAPVVEPPNVGDRPSGVYRIQPQPLAPPASTPGGIPPTRIFVIPLGPLLVAATVFGVVYFWSTSDAPSWVSELNPITGQPYSGRQEYDEVQRLSPEEILQRQAARIKATQPQPPPAPAPPPAPTLTPEQQREQDKKRERCAKIATKIDDIINKERDPTPPGGRPQGRKGIKWRWIEIGENKGKWVPQPDGSPSRAMQGHLDAYAAGQREIRKELDKWKAAECDDMDHGLPRNARQYAAQKPEFGPGKPMDPAPKPEYYPPVTPPAIVPQPKKVSK